MNYAPCKDCGKENVWVSAISGRCKECILAEEHSGVYDSIFI